VRHLLCHINKTKLPNDNRSDSSHLIHYGKVPLNLLHKSLGPCLNKFSATPKSGQTSHWCVFWPWESDFTSWLHFRPVSSLQTCLAILIKTEASSCCWTCPAPVAGVLWGCAGETCALTALLLSSAPASHFLAEQSNPFVCTISCMYPAKTPRSSSSHFSDSSDITTADMVGSCSKLMQNTNMCLWQSTPPLNSLGGCNSIQCTKSLSDSIVLYVLEDDL